MLQQLLLKMPFAPLYYHLWRWKWGYFHFAFLSDPLALCLLSGPSSTDTQQRSTLNFMLAALYFSFCLFWYTLLPFSRSCLFFQVVSFISLDLKTLIKAWHYSIIIVKSSYQTPYLWQKSSVKPMPMNKFDGCSSPIIHAAQRSHVFCQCCSLYFQHLLPWKWFLSLPCSFSWWLVLPHDQNHISPAPSSQSLLEFTLQSSEPHCCLSPHFSLSPPPWCLPALTTVYIAACECPHITYGKSLGSLPML